MAFEKPARHALMDRHALFLLRVWIDGATAEETLREGEPTFSPRDDALRQTWPCDPGQEMALHKQQAQSAGWKIDLDGPHSP